MHLLGGRKWQQRLVLILLLQSMTSFKYKSLFVSDGEKIYHSYYKWASPLIFFQAILFYLPHYFWKNLEGGRVSNIREYMWGDVVDPDIFEDIKTRGSGLATFVVKTMHRSRFLYMNYIFCKFLNVANVVANMMFINYYLEDAFFKYGWGAIKHFQTNLYDGSDPIQEVTFKIHANCIDLLLMSQLIWKQVFPFVTKCDFKIYGPSGTTSFYDAMCLLPWNPLHAKFYIVIWFWLIILLGLSVLNLVYRLADFFLPVLRRFHLRRLQPPSVNNSTTSNSPTQTLVKRLSIGNFYFVYMLGHNMDSLIFSYFLNELSQLLSSNDKNSHERTNEHEMKPIIKIC